MTGNSKDYSEEYDMSAGKYNFIVNLFQLGRDTKHRKKALKLAELKKGDTVLDICCGSGLSFRAIQSMIGNEGKIIAVDANAKMLALAKERAQKNGWENIVFIHSGIEDLELNEKADLALFALCWYDREVGTGWVQKIKHYLEPTAQMCFLDYKLPRNWLRYITTPVIWILVKWLGEAYGLEELKWDPKEEIGNLLKDPVAKSYYFDCIIAICGQPL